MKPTLSVLAIAGAAALLFAQAPAPNTGRGYRAAAVQKTVVPGGRTLPAFEVLSVFPRELSPGEYNQVDQAQLTQLAEQGWELASVTPYVYRNEEHTASQNTGAKLVTQVYPAYYFKRLKADQ